MCLDLQRGYSSMVADEDIICYKVIFNYCGCSKYRTFYQISMIELGEKYHSKLELYTDGDTFDGHSIEMGLHTFCNLKDTKSFVRSKAGQYTNRDIVIAKCIIPKGSTYYKGIFRVRNKNIESYASDTLQYEEIVTK